MRMRRRVAVVVLCVCVSVCLLTDSLTATYLVCESQAQCYMIVYGYPNACIVWISQTRERFVGQFWRHLLILSFLTSLGPALCYDFTYKLNAIIYGIGPSYACVRVTRVGYASEERINIKLAVFRDLLVMTHPLVTWLSSYHTVCSSQRLSGDNNPDHPDLNSMLCHSYIATHLHRTVHSLLHVDIYNIGICSIQS